MSPSRSLNVPFTFPVGQGTYDGQQVAFLMTPDAETPEPGALAIWGLTAACAGAKLIGGRAHRSPASL